MFNRRPKRKGLGIKGKGSRELELVKDDSFVSSKLLIKENSFDETNSVNCTKKYE